MEHAAHRPHAPSSHICALQLPLITRAERSGKLGEMWTDFEVKHGKLPFVKMNYSLPSKCCSDMARHTLRVRKTLRNLDGRSSQARLLTDRFDRGMQARARKSTHRCRCRQRPCSFL